MFLWQDEEVGVFELMVVIIYEVFFGGYEQFGLVKCNVGFICQYFIYDVVLIGVMFKDIVEGVQQVVIILVMIVVFVFFYYFIIRLVIVVLLVVFGMGGFVYKLFIGYQLQLRCQSLIESYK